MKDEVGTDAAGAAYRDAGSGDGAGDECEVSQDAGDGAGDECEVSQDAGDGVDLEAGVADNDDAVGETVYIKY